MQPSNAYNAAGTYQAEVDSVVDQLQHAEPSRVPVHSRPGTGRRLGVVVIALIAALTVAFLIRHYVNSRHEGTLAADAAEAAVAPAGVDVVRVEYASPTHLLVLPGQTRAWYDTTIYARVSGYIRDFKKDIGDHVTKGTVLATIDTPELDAQLAAARAKLKATQSEVEVARANADFALTTNKRWAAAEAGTVSKQEQEEKDAEYKAAVAKLRAAESQVNLNAADVKQLEAMEQFKDVTAPFDGTITGRRIDVGDLVTAGSTASTTSLFDLAQTDTIRVFVDVPQSAAMQISDGMPARAEAAGRIYTGKVARTSRSIDPAAKTLAVEVDINNKDLSLMPGMYVEVSFQTRDGRPPLRVPASALNFRSGGPQVAVVSRDGIVKFHNVTIARDLGDAVEIGSGLAEGDRVALNISNQIADGDKVDATEIADPNMTPLQPPTSKSGATAVVQWQQ